MGKTAVRAQDTRGNRGGMIVTAVGSIFLLVALLAMGAARQSSGTRLVLQHFLDGRRCLAAAEAAIEEVCHEGGVESVLAQMLGGRTWSDSRRSMQQGVAAGRIERSPGDGESTGYPFRTVHWRFDATYAALREAPRSRALFADSRAPSWDLVHVRLLALSPWERSGLVRLHVRARFTEGGVPMETNLWEERPFRLEGAAWPLRMRVLRPLRRMAWKEARR